jgi:hypothetical protein
MRTEGRTGTVAAIALAAALLLWPALWNGYPLVFSDTGTYLSQAIEHYIGWDRPIFYSLFLLPLHMTLTTWPVIAVQALLVVYILHLVLRTLLPAASVWWLLPLVGTLTLTTSLPWFASQLTPDVFAGTLVLTLALLVIAPLTTRERVCLAAIATFMVATHQSHVPLAFALLLALLPFRRFERATLLWSITPLLLAVLALVAVNLVAFGRASPSPFGNVFLLTRVIYDGPGRDALRRDCPASGWRLCAFADRLPPNADDFLWRADGPVALSGGAKLVSREAGAIIAAAVFAEPGTELRAGAWNSVRQLGRFATGDGLQPWATTVTPRIDREFPRFEAAQYAASRQSAGTLEVPRWMQALHAATALTAVAVCCALLLAARRRHPASVLAAVVLVALLTNAAITGGLSGPHDRYQSRVMWLPPLIAMLGVASLRATAARTYSR